MSLAKLDILLGASSNVGLDASCLVGSLASLNEVVANLMARGVLSLQLLGDGLLVLSAFQVCFLGASSDDMLIAFINGVIDAVSSALDLVDSLGGSDTSSLLN